MSGRARLFVAVLGGVILLQAACGNGNGGELAEAREADPARGLAVYAEMGCWTCHEFSAATAAIPGDARSVGPNLDEVARLYDADFIRESITDPGAYIEKGASGSIEGDEEYGTPMPAFGPDAAEPRTLTEAQLADLVAFIVSGAD
jgi:cytochrome c551/c552